MCINLIYRSQSGSEYEIELYHKEKSLYKNVHYKKREKQIRV